MRRAISLAIDRGTLARSAYGGFAQASTGIFNPQFELSETQLFAEEGRRRCRKADSADKRRFRQRYFHCSQFLQRERTACAKLIEQQLEEAGFDVTIYEEDDARYFDRISKEQFNLYIGEIKLPPDMSLRPFFDSDGSARYGIDPAGSASAAAYHAYMDGSGQIGDFPAEIFR